MNCCFCHLKVFHVCQYCHNGAFNIDNNRKYNGFGKCPNGHIYHFICSKDWLMFESYCVVCQEDLIELDKCVCTKS